MKKSQITLFMLFGILILFLIGFFFIFLVKKTETAEQTKPIQAYIEQCIKDVGINAVEYVSLQGGYFSTPEPYYKYGQYKVAYIIYNSTPLLASQKNIEEQLGLYVDERLERCIANFSTFALQGYEIHADSPHTTALMREDSVLFTVVYPVTAIKYSTITYSAFAVELPSALYLARTVAQEIIEAHNSDAKIPLSRLNEISEKYTVSMNLGNFNNTVIYAIALPKHPSLFIFAVQYKWGELDE